MGKIINATIFAEKVDWLGRHGTPSMRESVPVILKLIESAPDVRKRGHWIGHSYEHEEPMNDMWFYNECSNCHKTTIDNYDYCPFCGCEMSEEI